MSFAITSSPSQFVGTPDVATPAAKADVAGAGALASSAALPPYQSLDISHLAGPLGLASPGNQGDEAALLAKVEAMLDETAAKGRSFEISSRLGAARSDAARSGLGLVDLNTGLAKDQAGLKTLQTKQAGLEAQEGMLAAQSAQQGAEVSDLSATVADLKAQIATASSTNPPDTDKVAQLTTALGQATGELDAAKAAKTTTDADLADTRQKLTDVAKDIEATEANIATDITAIHTAALAVFSAYADLAATVQTGDGTIARNRQTSVALRSSFAELTKTARDADQDMTKAVEAGARAKDARVKEEVENRVKDLAVGLSGGIVAVLDVLGQLVASGATATPEQTQSANSRVRLSL